MTTNAKKSARTRYQLPGVDNHKESWDYIRAYDAPAEPMEIPTDDDVIVPVEKTQPAATLAEAVPVRVVEFAREPDRFKDARIYQLSIAGGQQPVALGLRRERTRITFRVNSAVDTDVVYLGTGADVNANNGYPLTGGRATPPVEMTTQRALYLYNPGVAALNVSVIEEFVTELR